MTRCAPRFRGDTTAIRPGRSVSAAAAPNAASIRVMEKCGFRIVGYGKGFAKARGKEIEEVILELTDRP